MFAIVDIMILPLILLFTIPLGLAILAFWIWMLVHAIQNKGLSDGEKTGWVVAIAILHFIAALLYFFIGRPKDKTPLMPAPLATHL